MLCSGVPMVNNIDLISACTEVIVYQGIQTLNEQAQE